MSSVRFMLCNIVITLRHDRNVKTGYRQGERNVLENAVEYLDNVIIMNNLKNFTFFMS